MDLAGDPGVVGGELRSTTGHTQDDGLAWGQFVAGHQASCPLLRHQFPADLLCGAISRDAAPLANALD